ncbi:uncharacterized protein [Miscanthus floridulus]|uniref:uncharacterized protein n=1 Tax=Miscanthus floridulus TaxID=154761 RepID=UPI00345A03AD
MNQNNMYVTTSRCDDYPTSVKSQEAIKEMQSAPYQIFAGTNCSSDLSNTYRYKKGGYTELMMEQIRNSQEDNQTDWNTQQHEEMQGSLTKMILGNDRNENMRLEDLDGIFGPQTDWSISESRLSYEVHTDTTTSIADDDRSKIQQYHWQTDVFNNKDIDEVQHENQDDQPTMGENDLRIIAIEPTISDITSTVTDDNEDVNGSQELTEEEIEEFIKNEQVAASKGNNAPINSKYTPQLLMGFKSRDDAHHFFNFYAFLVGFQVAITHTTRTQSKKRNNENVKVFAANDGLYEDFEDIVNNSLTVEEFERLWKRMIEERNLQGNHYFSKMWEMRKRFIPVYYKNDFFPFVQTTSRSEATNVRFKDNVGPTYSIISFLKEYNRIVDTINRAERLEDSYSKQKRPKEFIFGYRIEQQAQ